jgi:hypothetical protein
LENRIVVQAEGARIREMNNSFKTLVKGREGKILLARPRRRWESNIKMDLEGIGYVK